MVRPSPRPEPVTNATWPAKVCSLGAVASRSPPTCGMNSSGFSAISRFAWAIAFLGRGCFFGRRPGDTEARETFWLVIGGAHVDDDGGLRLDAGITQGDIEQSAVMMQAPALQIGTDILERFVSEQGRDKRVERLGQVRVASRLPHRAMKLQVQ